jgi:hypothetical protein
MGEAGLFDPFNIRKRPNDSLPSVQQKAMSAAQNFSRTERLTNSR